MDTLTSNAVQLAVRGRNGKTAHNAGTGSSGCCAPTCCRPRSRKEVAIDTSQAIGHSLEEIAVGPEGTNLGLGCGTPQTSMNPGETVLNHGSGAGVDASLAARQVDSVLLLGST
jgi:hypothetical protein